jgi:hypothetical protein
VDIAGGSFWTNGIFWGAAGAIIGLISVIAVVWVTIRVARPRKRQLLVSLTAVTPLLTTQQGIEDKLRVTYDSHLLRAPHTAAIRLESRGRRLDIPRSAFDDGKPLRLNLGTVFLEILEVITSQGSTAPAVSCSPDRHGIAAHEGFPLGNTELLVGPSLIKWDQKIEISVLTEGKPQLGPLRQQLENVGIVDYRPGEFEKQAQTARRTAIWLGAVLATAAISGLGVALSPSVASWITNPGHHR